jgi:pimeloyl-ACP methyl ester carboxylesterase
MYEEKRVSRSEFVPIRGLDYHVRVWSAGAALPPNPPLVLVHGWMDVGASYQFMVDAFSEAFARGRAIIAPDWRGFGLTKNAGGLPVDNYWHADYLADLDFLLDHYAPGAAVDLVGHSMGGNVVMAYAGARPARIRRLVNLEGFGQPASMADDAPARYAQWMDQLKEVRRGALDLSAYDEVGGVARRLMKTNPRLPRDKADWLAGRWAQPAENGRWTILGDPAHKVISAQLYRADETEALYRRIAAPLLMVEASEDSLSKWWKDKFTLDAFHARLALVPDLRTEVLPDTGHMLHHDQPQALAALLESFLA